MAKQGLATGEATGGTAAGRPLFGCCRCKRTPRQRQRQEGKARAGGQRGRGPLILLQTLRLFIADNESHVSSDRGPLVGGEDGN